MLNYLQCLIGSALFAEYFFGVSRLNWVKSNNFGRTVFFLCFCTGNVLIRLLTESHFKVQGPIVQSIFSLTSSLVVEMLTVLVCTISDSKAFLLKNCQ